MSIAGSSRKANVIVNTTNNTGSTIATGYYPNSAGDPGKYVTINTYYNAMSHDYKVFALTHELGHVCGFTHTDGTYGSIIPGTPELDPNSVMNSFVLPWSGFTNFDLSAIRTIYPR